MEAQSVVSSELIEVKEYTVSPKFVFWFEIIRATAFFCFGVWILHILYYYCLFNPNTNNIVTVYFCLLSLGCFLSIGIPIDKISNISLTGK